MAKKQSKKKYLRVVLPLVLLAIIAAVTYTLHTKNTPSNSAMTIQKYLGCNRVTADSRDTDIFCSDAGIAVYRRGHVAPDDFPPSHYQEQGFEQFKIDFEHTKSKADCLITYKGDDSQCN